ncbi:MAG: RHS repeat-associated core domain-containing protein [Chlamydiota bacterium]
MSFFGSKKYDYDPLNQLVQEGQQSYFFDSIGNPSRWEVNNCNRILSTPECTLRYDPDGNPIGRTTGRKDTTYDYDALGRLVRMETSDKIIFYTYDPISRLLSKEIKSKWWGGSKVLYLYDKEYEIGTISPSNEIQQLKVLGLGLKGDIGAAVAIEIKGAIYAPLHDFSGNILAIITTAGKIAKTYQMDAFGKQKGDPDELNPWQFCSKRCEENLVFFGLRFYDPSLGRWLTPDPSGFAEGPNLYLYALNNPTNRLDLFGLKSIDSYTWYTDPDAKIDIQIEKIYSSPTARDLIHCKGTIDGVRVDFIVACGHWEKLKYTAEELNEGKINIYDHIHELMPKEGSMVGLITAQNGINTSFNEFRRSCKGLMRENKEGSLFVGLYNRTEGFVRDLFRVMDERKGVETSAVLTTRHFLENMGERLQQMCPGTLSMHFSHSEGGMIAYLALKGMNPDSKMVIQRQLISFSLGAAHPVPKEFCHKAENYYSKKDYITGRFGKEHMNDPAYDIQWADCSSSITQRTGYIADHAMLGNTYGSLIEDGFKNTRKDYGFYDGRDR